MLNLAKRVNHWVWDPNEERKRLEMWQQEQERLLQVHWWNGVYVHGSVNVLVQDVLDVCIYVCISVCVCVSRVYYSIKHAQCFSAGAIRERTGEAEEGVGESTARGGGGGKKTQ